MRSSSGRCDDGDDDNLVFKFCIGCVCLSSVSVDRVIIASIYPCRHDGVHCCVFFDSSGVLDLRSQALKTITLSSSHVLKLVFELFGLRSGSTMPSSASAAAAAAKAALVTMMAMVMLLLF